MSPPLLTRVIYELFESDVEELLRPGANTEHSIDREIRLELSDGVIQYVSWTDEPVQYCVGVQKHSFFVSGEVVIRDLSDHPIWCKCLGRPIQFVMLDAEHQVLEVRSSVGSVFVSSFARGTWWGDTIRVSALKPVLNSDGAAA